MDPFDNNKNKKYIILPLSILKSVEDLFIFQLTNNFGQYSGNPFGGAFNYPYSFWYGGTPFNVSPYTNWYGGSPSYLFGGGMNTMYGGLYNNLFGTYGNNGLYTGLNPYFGRVGYSIGRQNK